MNIQKLHHLFLDSTGVSIDSREIKKNNLFFAIKGEKFDGNSFAKNALNQGAKYAIIDNPKFSDNERYILVEDVLTCLQQLAKYHRGKLNCHVLGITGTNGKTTTKELINVVISKKFRTVSTKGNLNNHIGVPLTILRANLQTEFLIIEMGANHVREIEFLCSIAQINYGIITNIGMAHLEGFGNEEGIIEAKRELYTHIKCNKGTLFVNADDKLLMSISKDINQVNYHECKLKKIKTFFAEVSFKDRLITSKLIGNYNKTNILAACRIGNYFGVSLNNIKNAIESYVPSNNRSQLLKTKDNTIILDAYNANPSSMIEAIKSFENVMHDKKIYILGDMLELGKNSSIEHQKIIDYLSQEENNVIIIGEEFGKCKHNFIHFKNSQEAKTWIKKSRIIDNIILLKGSRMIKLETITKVL